MIPRAKVVGAKIQLNRARRGSGVITANCAGFKCLIIAIRAFAARKVGEIGGGESKGKMIEW